MWNQILNIMIQCCSQAYSWFTQLLMGIGDGVNGPWYTIFGIMCAMLGTRFILYPFLKGRVVGGVGEEFGRNRNNYSNHYIYDQSDSFNPVNRG